MKRVAAALGAAVWLCLVPPSPALAALLRDDCDGEAPSWASYSNLSPSAYWSGLEDPSCLILSHPGSLGQAVYRLSGAQTVEIILHTRMGAFATLEGDQWTLTSSLTGLSPGECRAVEFCPMDNSLYVSMGASSLRAQVSPQSGAILFIPSDHGHPHTQRYGLNLSADTGRGFVPCQATLVSVEAIQNMGVVEGYIEAYRARLPAGTAAVQVSLRDFTHYYSADGSLITAQNQASLWLARVGFTGSSLSTGGVPGGEGSSGLPPPEGGVPPPGEPGQSGSEQFFTPPDQVPRPEREEPQLPKETSPGQPGAPPQAGGQTAQSGNEPPAQEGEGSSSGGEAARPPRETGLLPPPSRDLAGWATLFYVGVALVGITIILRKMK